MEKEEIRFDVPVVMIVYKRYDLTERSFEQIRKLKQIVLKKQINLLRVKQIKILKQIVLKK